MRPAFVISPIGRPDSAQRLDADEVLDLFIRPPARKFGFEPYRGDSVSSPGMIVSQICESIIRDPLIFAYLKDGNPNVYYELAIAHALKKPVVLIKDPHESIPFDVGGARIISVDRNNIAQSHLQIEQQLLAISETRSTAPSPIDITPEQILALTMPRVAAADMPTIDVSGIWTGFTIESFPLGASDTYKHYHAEMRLNALGNYITGQVFIAYGDDYDRPAQNTAVLQLHGSYRAPRFARLHYDNDKIPDHCGLLFIEFTNEGTDAVGTFAGCGVASKQPVHGKITMRKAEPSRVYQSPRTAKT